MKDEEYKAMLELAALDALDEAESHALQKHLETCDECREELDALRDAFATLAYLAEPVEASAELRARVLGGACAPVTRKPSRLNTNEDS
jgi:predicted anti-sigma-YlaC factor YlaD